MEKVLSAGDFAYSRGVRPNDIQWIGSEMAIKWADGTESFLSLENLRRYCPCAGCRGEMDTFGKLYKSPDAPLSPKAFALRQWAPVGGYAIQPVWEDGHSTGIYSWEYLKRLADATSQQQS